MRKGIDDLDKYTIGVRQRQAELDAKQVAEAMNEPTLTCSEVVERLRLALQYHGNVEAEKILHSWRERRVQELEKLLGEAITFIEATAAIGRGVPTLTSLPPYSEWREQIRKGAKHE